MLVRKFLWENFWGIDCILIVIDLLPEIWKQAETTVRRVNFNYKLNFKKTNFIN